MSSNGIGSQSSARKRHAAAFVQIRKVRPGSAKVRRRHVIVSVAPTQLTAIDGDAKKSGRSREAFVQTLTEMFLHAPTPLIAGGSYHKPDRVRMRFHITESLHHAVTKIAQEIGVPMTVIFTTAIHNRYPV